MMSEEKNSDFHTDLKKDSSAENLATLRRSRSAFIGHITRLINQINEKLSLNDNSKVGLSPSEKIFCLLQ